MDQIKHKCICGHEWTSDKCADLCPSCGDDMVIDNLNIDSPAINETRPEQAIETSREPGVYVDEDFCGGRK